MKLYKDITVKEFDFIWALGPQCFMNIWAIEILKDLNIIWTYTPEEGNQQDIMITTIGDITTDNMGRKILMDSDGTWSGMYIDDSNSCYCRDRDKDRLVRYVTEEQVRDTKIIFTLEQLADYLNDGERFQFEIEWIIKANGWTLSDNKNEVCKDKEGRSLMMDENSGRFEVKSC